MKSFLLLFSFLILFSCKGDTQVIKEKASAKEDTIYEDTTYIDLKGNKYQHIGQIPQNLLTTEQVKLIDKLNEVIINNTSVKNNHMVFNLSKDEFVAKGLSPRFYDIIKKNIRDNNEFFDVNGIKDVDKMVEERKILYESSEKDTVKIKNSNTP